MASSMKAALNLGKDFVKNSEIHLDTKFENVESVFDITQKNWYRNSLEKFWTWNAWDIHHRHERDEYWQIIRRSSGQRQEYLSTLILFYVLVRRNKVQEQQKSRKANLKTPYQDAVGIDGEAVGL